MPDISRITLPSGNSYDLKDATARQMISGGVKFIIAWNGSTYPDVADIPAGVVVTYQTVQYTGTMPASSSIAGAFYLVASATNEGTVDHYDEYVAVSDGTESGKTWEKIGDTQVDYSNIVQSITVGQNGATPVNGVANITSALSTYLSDGYDGLSAYILFLSGTSDENIGLFNDGPGVTPVSYFDMLNCMMAARPVVVLHPQTPSSQNYDIYTPLAAVATVEGGVELYMVMFSYVDAVGGIGKLAAVDSNSYTGNLTGSIITQHLVRDVTLNKSTDIVLGEATTFTLSSGTVTHGALTGHTTAVVTGYSSPTTDTFVKSVSAETNKNLVTTTVPNITNVGAPSTWSFTMGTGNDAETLIISGANNTAPTLGTAITVATGSTSTSGTGDPVVTGVTIGSSASAITALGTANTANALTSMPTSTVGTAITVGTNDKVTTLTNATSLTVV